MVPAPSRQEGPRAELVAGWAREVSDATTAVDEAGNVVVEMAGRQPDGAVSTYLATLDDLDTIAALRRRGAELTLTEHALIGPCVQTCSSAATAMSLLRYAARGERRWARLTVAFVTGEETGLTGARALVAQRRDTLGEVLDIMGGVGTISYHAIGIRALRVTFTGSDRHSLGGGMSAVPDAMARLVLALHAAVPAPGPQDTEIRRVNQLQAGQVFNHSPAKGQVTVDVRATDPVRLDLLAGEVDRHAAAIAADLGIAARVDPIIEQPAARLPGGADHPLVVAAADATRLAGHEPVLRPWTSSNVSAILAAGLPGIALEGTARGGDRGTPREWADIDGVLAGAAVCCHLLDLRSGR